MGKFKNKQWVRIARMYDPVDRYLIGQEIQLNSEMFTYGGTACYEYLLNGSPEINPLTRSAWYIAEDCLEPIQKQDPAWEATKAAIKWKQPASVSV